MHFQCGVRLCIRTCVKIKKQKNFTRDLIRLRTIITYNGDIMLDVGLLLATVFGLWENIF